MSRAVHPSPRATFQLPVAFLHDFDRDRGLSCPACDLLMDLHQPDPRDPDLLLGTCPKCGAWHLIETAPDQVGVAIVTLPGGDEVRAAIRDGE